MTRLIVLSCSFFAAIFALQGDRQQADQKAVHVEPANLQGPRPLAKQTENAVIQDYLQAWDNLGAAFNQNRPDLLEAEFVGTAKDKLTATIEQQAKAGIRTHYIDKSHDIQIVFYSPEGLSLQLIDNVQYDVQIFDHDRALAAQQVSARYVVVMTPAEVRWRVRVFQSQPE